MKYDCNPEIVTVERVKCHKTITYMCNVLLYITLVIKLIETVLC